MVDADSRNASPVRAFTSITPKRLLQLITTVTIKSDDKAIPVKALWDTGATSTCIAKEVAEMLNLTVTSMNMMQTPSGNYETPSYSVDLILPNKVTVTGLVVFGSEIGEQGIGVLIGMDVITLGDFAVSCKDEVTYFSYRYPSQEHADFVKTLKVNNANDADPPSSSTD